MPRSRDAARSRKRSCANLGAPCWRAICWTARHTLPSCRRALRLARLYGNGLAVLGGTAQITHGGLPYDLPQCWSKALYGHPMTVDGIAYRSRHDDNEVCFALFDRAPDALVVKSREPNPDQDWFYALMDRYHIGMAPAV